MFFRESKQSQKYAKKNKKKQKIDPKNVKYNKIVNKTKIIECHKSKNKVKIKKKRILMPYLFPKYSVIVS